MPGQLEGSILTTIKQMLGMDMDYPAFDTDVITHINSALMILQQLGVGPEEGMIITGSEDKWDDFFQAGQMLEAAKSYIYLHVKLLFDPPNNSFVINSMKETKDMYESRLKEQAKFYSPEKKKYASNSANTSETYSVNNSIQSFNLLSEEINPVVHIERNGITPIDDIGQNVIMEGRF